jgi:hypothetical protein
MSPKRIYDQPIANWPSDTWLCELRHQEAEDDLYAIPLPTSSLALAAAQDLESAAQKIRQLPGQGAQEAVAEANHDHERVAALGSWPEASVLKHG